jgi:hypothetical protein
MATQLDRGDPGQHGQPCFGCAVTRQAAAGILLVLRRDQHDRAVGAVRHPPCCGPQADVSPDQLDVDNSAEFGHRLIHDQLEVGVSDRVDENVWSVRQVVEVGSYRSLVDDAHRMLGIGAIEDPDVGSLFGEPLGARLADSPRAGHHDQLVGKSRHLVSSPDRGSRF